MPSAEVSPGRARPQGRALSQQQAGPWRAAPGLWGPGLAPGHSPRSRAVCSIPWSGVGGRPRQGAEATAGAQPATQELAPGSAPAGLRFQAETGARASLPQRAALRRERREGVTARKILRKALHILGIQQC